MKKILMTAVAVSALSAGAASAASLSLANTATAYQSTFAGVSLFRTATSVEPFTIATETDTATLTAAGAGTAVLVFKPSATGIAAGSYLVTWNVSGGTFGSTGIAVSGTQLLVTDPVGGTQTCTVSVPSATSISALCTSTTAVGTFTLSAPINVTQGVPVSVSGSIQTQSGGTAVDGGTITGGTIVDFRSGLIAAAAVVNPKLSIGDLFKKFAEPAGATCLAAPLTTTLIGTGLRLKANDNPTTLYSGDAVYINAAGLAVSGNVGTIVPAAATVTVTGDSSVYDYVLSATTTNGSATAGVGVCTDYVFDSNKVVGAGALSVIGTNLTSSTTGLTGSTGIKVGLQRKAAVLAGASSTAGKQSSYSITINPVAATGYTVGSYASAALGSVSYEGTSFLAPWVGDGSNGITYTIRIGNRSATLTPKVQVTLLNPYATGTTGTATTANYTGVCEFGSVPASGELQITSDALRACFGSFKRSDLTITIGTGTTGASVANVTAKMRVKSTNETVSDVTLGGGAGVATLD